MSLSPFFNTIISLQSNTMSLSPFDIKGKGWITTNILSRMRKKGSADLIYTEVAKLPLSSCWIFKHVFQWSTWLCELPITKDSYLHQRSNQVDLHMRLNYPTKWVYTIQLSYPTKWIYKILKSPYMTEYYNFTSWVSTRPFHQNTNMNFHNQHQKNFKEHISKPT